MVVASQQQIYQPNYSAQPGLTKRILYISIEDKSAQSAITERTCNASIAYVFQGEFKFVTCRQ